MIALDDDRWRQRLDFQFMVPIARGRVRIARGDHEGAVRELSQAKEAGEQLVGSAPFARAWVALEQDGPWGAKAFTASHLDPGLGGEQRHQALARHRLLHRQARGQGAHPTSSVYTRT
mgnify:CR=1 FL=1